MCVSSIVRTQLRKLIDGCLRRLYNAKLTSGLNQWNYKAKLEYFKVLALPLEEEKTAELPKD